MLINFNHIKTFYNALVQKMKGFRGNWEQNDDTADDYIKNRTHWSEGIKEVEILSERSIDVENAYYRIDNPFKISLIVGTTYIVTFDGVKYESVAKETFNNEPFIGNSSILGWNDNKNTGEPFFVDVYEQQEVTFACTTSGNHTISISTKKEVIHKLDKKFIDMPDLPDNLVTEDNIFDTLDLASVAFTNDYESLDNKPTIYTDVVRYGEVQTLTDVQKEQARNNIGVDRTHYEGRKTLVDYTFDELNPYAGANVGIGGIFSLVSSRNSSWSLAMDAQELYWGDVRLVKRGTAKFTHSQIPTYKGDAAVFGNASYLSIVQDPWAVDMSSISTEDTGEASCFAFFEKDLSEVSIIYIHKGDKANTRVVLDTIEVVQLDEKFIPDNIPKIQTAVVGQAATVKSVDENGKPTEWGAETIPVTDKSIITDAGEITWDRNTSGLETVTVSGPTIGARVFYKVSDIVLTRDDIVSCQITSCDANWVEKDYEYPSIPNDHLCTSIDQNAIALYDNTFISVKKGGSYLIQLPEGNVNIMSAPSAGTYFYYGYDTYKYTSKVSYALKKAAAEFATPYMVVPSSTFDSTKKFAITIDDSGTVTASSDDTDIIMAKATDIVQPDLSQNDPNAADYVKNRTHWVEEAIILSETVVEINDGQGVIEPPFTVNDGEKYVVTYNGVDYETQAKIIHGVICLGNGSVLDSSVENTEEPFIIGVVNGSVMLVDPSGVTSATLSIKGDCYHTLKSAYLPTATENSVGGVRFGRGETLAARVVNIYFDATKEEFEHAIHLSRRFGVVLEIAGDKASYCYGELDNDDGVRCKLLKTEPSLVIARLDSEGNFTMKREYDTGRIIRSSGGKYFEINVDDNGTLSAIEISNPY